MRSTRCIAEQDLSVIMTYQVKTTIYVITILLISSALAQFLYSTEPEPVAQSLQADIPVVDVIQVSKHNLSPAIKLTGRLRPALKAQLRFEIAGRIDQRLVEPGRKVQQTDVLLTLNSGDYQDAVAEAEAQHTLESASIQRDKQLLLLAQHNTALQKKEVKRLKRLGKGALVSQSRLGEARQRLYQLQAEEASLTYKVETATARLALRKTALERAKRNLERTQLKAPFAGVVNSVSVQKGDFVSTSQVVVELVSNNQLEMYLQVRNQIATDLQLGSKVDVKVGQTIVAGTIVALQADPDSSTYTHELRISLPKDVGVAGMLAEVSLSLKPLEQVIAIPIAAVLQQQGIVYVMRVDDKNVVYQQEITLGQRVDDLYVVESGLEAGEKIVHGDLSILKSGQKISARKHNNLDVTKQ